MIFFGAHILMNYKQNHLSFFFTFYILFVWNKTNVSAPSQLADADSEFIIIFNPSTVHDCLSLTHKTLLLLRNIISSLPFVCINFVHLVSNCLPTNIVSYLSPYHQLSFEPHFHFSVLNFPVQAH